MLQKNNQKNKKKINLNNRFEKQENIYDFSLNNNNIQKIIIFLMI